MSHDQFYLNVVTPLFFILIFAFLWWDSWHVRKTLDRLEDRIKELENKK